MFYAKAGRGKRPPGRPPRPYSLRRGPSVQYAVTPPLPEARMAARRTVLCVSSYFKGNRFLRRAKREGARVYLLTLESLRDAG